MARLLSLMTDDVVFLNPGQAPFGRDEFPIGFTAAHQQSLIHCVSEVEEVMQATAEATKPKPRTRSRSRLADPLR
ncbi:MAG: nuclear transport factor 2 family protein [Bacteriovorax sp.]|nr:nuclear transport factor 2 family protein [Rhizobacter sp.]